MDPMQRQPRKYGMGDFMFKCAEPAAGKLVSEGQSPEKEVEYFSEKDPPMAFHEQARKESAGQKLDDGEGKQKRAEDCQGPLCGVDDSGKSLRHGPET